MKSRVIAPLLILMTLFTSCVKEDVSMCSPGLELKFLYTLNTDEVDKFALEVEQVSVLVFDKQGIYIDTYTQQSANLLIDQTLLLPLPAGTYSIVTYGGLLDNYLIGELSPETGDFVPALRKGATTIENLLLKTSSTAFGLPESTVEPLFHCLNANVVVLSQEQPTKIAAELTKNTNKIGFRISGLEFFFPTQVKSVAPHMDIYCHSANDRYKYDNSIGGNPLNINYNPTERTNEGNLEKVDISVLRLLQESPTMFFIKNRETNEVVLSLNIVDIILKHPDFATNQNLDKCDEYLIDIKLEQDITVNISVNGWDVIEIKPEVE